MLLCCVSHDPCTHDGRHSQDLIACIPQWAATTTIGFLNGLIAVLRAEKSLFDSLMLTLRKSLFSRVEEGRAGACMSLQLLLAEGTLLLSLK